MLTSGLEFAWRGTGLQRLVACSIAAFFLCLQVCCTPYRERNSNHLKTAADANVLLAIIASMLLHDESMQPSNGGTVSAAEPFDRDTYGWMLVMTTSFVVSMCFAECINRVRRMWRINAKMSDDALLLDDAVVALSLTGAGACITDGRNLVNLHQDVATDLPLTGGFTVDN